MERISELIAGVPEFSGLSDQERLELAQVAIRKSYEKNEYIAHYGDVWPYLFVVDTGLINVVKISTKGRILGALQGPITGSSRSKGEKFHLSMARKSHTSTCAEKS